LLIINNDENDWRYQIINHYTLNLFVEKSWYRDSVVFNPILSEVVWKYADQLLRVIGRPDKWNNFYYNQFFYAYQILIFNFKN